MTGSVPGMGALEALVYVARQQGLDTSLDAVRRRFSVEDSQVATGALVALAGELGLRARSLRATWDDLPRFEKVLPAILRLWDGSVLVLDAVIDDPKVGRAAVVRDPTTGAETRALVDKE